MRAWDCAELVTTFASLESIYLNPKSNVHVRYSILDLLQKSSFEQTLTHFLTLFYHIWLKTVSKGT